MAYADRGASSTILGSARRPGGIDRAVPGLIAVLVFAAVAPGDGHCRQQGIGTHPSWLWRRRRFNKG